MARDVLSVSDTADGYSEREFGAATFATFDPSLSTHRAAAVALYARFEAVGFGAAPAGALFGLNEIGAVQAGRSAYYDAFTLPHNPAGDTARFFVLHDTIADGALRALLGDDLVSFLIELAAIVEVEGGWRSIVSATWLAGRLIFSDARASDIVWPADLFADYVMPPGGDSVGLTRVAPRVARRATLDLCCGAGAQALAATAYSRRVVGVDLNPRALRFARFNAAVNAIENATFLLGDCYDPIGSERFDAILANPPFVPWPADGTELLFRGGGRRGDDVLARILAGAVERLEPHGSLAIVADLADTDTLPARIAKWQGVPRRTLLLIEQSYDLLSYAETHTGHLRGGARETLLVRLLRHFDACAIHSIDFGYVLQDGEPGSTHVVRTSAPLAGSIADDVGAWFLHQQRLGRGDIDEIVLELAPGLRVTREFAMTRDGRIAASSAALPGSGSMLGVTPISAIALSVLDRIATGGAHARDFVETQEARELTRLLDQGLIRLRSQLR